MFEPFYKEWQFFGSITSNIYFKRELILRTRIKFYYLAVLVHGTVRYLWYLNEQYIILISI